MAPSSLTVRSITPEQHLDFVRGQRSASFLQTPAWGRVKPEWRSESIGWFRGDELVGAGAGALPPAAEGQALPRLPARGPGHRLGRRRPRRPGSTRWSPTSRARAPSASGWARRWSPAAGPPRRSRRASPTTTVHRLGRASPPTERSARPAPGSSPSCASSGWQPQAVEGGFAAGQPQYNFQIPLRRRRRQRPHRGRRPQGHEPAVAPQHQEGRQGRRRGRASAAATTSRPSTTSTSTPPSATTSPRGRCRYFQTMVDALSRRGARPDPALPGPPRGRPGRGHDRDPGRRPRVVLLRRLLHREARRPRLQRGPVGDDPRRARRPAPTSTTCAASPTPSTPTTSHVGLIQFKVGTGGEAVEYAGEWDLPLNRALYKAFDLYMRRRG